MSEDWKAMRKAGEGALAKVGCKCPGPCPPAQFWIGYRLDAAGLSDTSKWTLYNAQVYPFLPAMADNLIATPHGRQFN